MGASFLPNEAVTIVTVIVNAGLLVVLLIVDRRIQPVASVRGCPRSGPVHDYCRGRCRPGLECANLKEEKEPELRQVDTAC